MHDFLKNLETLGNKVDYLTDTVTNVTSQNPKHIIYTEDQLCDVLGISKQTIRKWRQEGLISCSPIGRQCYYKLSDVLEMLDKYKVQAI